MNDYMAATGIVLSSFTHPHVVPNVFLLNTKDEYTDHFFPKQFGTGASPMLD